MDRKKLINLRDQLEGYRHTQPKARELHALAKALGRSEVDRGKEPTFKSDAFPSLLRPVSIPNHKGRDMSVGTKNNILNQLEDDLIAWEEFLDQRERENGGNGKI